MEKIDGQAERNKDDEPGKEMPLQFGEHRMIFLNSPYEIKRAEAEPLKVGLCGAADRRGGTRAGADFINHTLRKDASVKLQDPVPNTIKDGLGRRRQGCIRRTGQRREG